LEPVVEARIGLRVLRPHHRRRRARAKRHQDDVARRNLGRFRHPIRIGFVECHRDEDIDDAPGHGTWFPDSRGLRKGKGHGRLLRSFPRRRESSKENAAKKLGPRLRGDERTMAPDSTLTGVAPKVAAEIASWLRHLGDERKMSPKTVEAYRRDVVQFL